MTIYRTTVEAAKLARVSVRQLQHWASRGYVEPTTTIDGGVGYAGRQLAWDDEQIDRAELLGVVTRTAGASDLLERYARALKDGPNLTMTDRDYEVVVTVRVRSD